MSRDARKQRDLKKIETKRINIDFPVWVHRALKAQAASEGITLSSHIQQVLEESLISKKNKKTS
jgi:macrodomain Ter protein organizer (MatP/YcbG family)